MGATRLEKGRRSRCVTTSHVVRRHILISTTSQLYNKELKTLLDSRRDDASPVAEIGERKPGEGDKDGGKRKRLPLEDITRFTMVKRIW